MIQSRPTFAARCLFAASLALGAACRGAPPGAADAERADDAGAAAPPAPPARRPTRRYYVGRSRDGCQLYTVDGDALSAPSALPCPPDLQVEERIRLSGKTCIRTSPTDPTRDAPVICPDPLLRKEKQDRSARDAGP